MKTREGLKPAISTNRASKRCVNMVNAESDMGILLEDNNFIIKDVKRTAFIPTKFYEKHNIRPNEASVLHMIVCSPKALEESANDSYYRPNFREAMRIIARKLHGVVIPPQQPKVQLAKI